ncbi:MAG TPA: hemerythrin domain-containing protein [Burkholderiales bacterium]|nr:hemerythrin domain-containing protein [Burkholderiales bacterium]
MSETLDLRREADSRLALAALGALRELRPGRELRLITREDPTLLLESLNLQLRDALRWDLGAAGGHWEASIRLAGDAAPRDVLDTLRRDHRRLDELLAKALRRLNAGDVVGARPLLDGFASGLRRHARAENELLAPALGPQPAVEPLEIMLREHDELLVQLDAVERCFAEAPAGQLPEAWEIEPFVAILSGTLAKHEYREESQLFPLWAARLARRPQGEGETLHRALRALLEG